jgi:hypothetical protein
LGQVPQPERGAVGDHRVHLPPAEDRGRFLSLRLGLGLQFRDDVAAQMGKGSGEDFGGGELEAVVGMDVRLRPVGQLRP